MIHPVWTVPLGCLSAGVFSLSIYRPALFFFLFPLFMVCADAYPWTGQLVFREYDALLTASLSGALIRRSVADVHTNRSPQRFRTISIFALVLFALILVMAGIRGFTALPAASYDDQLSVYFTRWNTIRLAKGFVWGIAFTAMFRLLKRRDHKFADSPTFLFGLGILGALSWIISCIGWERYHYVGLFNFRAVHRATGPIWTMHTGGQHLDALLVLGFPLGWLAIRLLGQASHRSKNVGLKLAGLLIAFMIYLLFCSYGVLATMSRATIAIFALQVAAVVAMAGFHTWSKAAILSSHSPISRLRTAFVYVFDARRLLAASCGLALAILFLGVALASTGIRGRFQNFSSGMESRWNHWTMVGETTTSNWNNLMLGYGLGTLPTQSAQHYGFEIPPASLLQSPDGKVGIALAGGWPLYVEIMTSGNSAVRIRGEFDSISDSITAKTADGTSSRILVTRAFKSLFDSYETTTKEFVSGSSFDAVLETPQLRSADNNGFKSGIANQRFQTAAIYTLEQPASIKSLFIDDSNGSAKPLFFTCDNHLVWRAKNAILQLAFEFGWPATIIATIFALSRVVTGGGDPELKLSALGIVAIGCFGSIFDTAWLTSLTIAILCLQWRDASTVVQAEFG